MSVVSEEKERIELSQIFHFNSSEVKQYSECSEWNKTGVSVVSEEKHHSESSQIFHFNSSEEKQRN